MSRKFALVIGNSQYRDAGLARLAAPDVDVRALVDVLKAPDVGNFDDVIQLIDEDCSTVRREIARFYDQKRRDDLLLLYFSGHGVKDDQGQFYLAVRDTERNLLAGTALESSFITGRMDGTHSTRQVVVLDCCHSGAFARGTKAAQGGTVGIASSFEGKGAGRVILSATDATQYAWEGQHVIGHTENSLFTHYLVEGMRTGAADSDEDGLITVDELFDYAYEEVIDKTPTQTPCRWAFGQHGHLVLAQNAHRVALPPEVEETITSRLPTIRLEAVKELDSFLRGHHVGRARTARAFLKDLAQDDSRKVASAATEVLAAFETERRDGPAQQTAEDTNHDLTIPALPPLTAEAERIKDASERQEGAISIAQAGPRARRPGSGGIPAERPATDVVGADIFVSYAREDRDKARTLADLLAARGWSVWWDRRIAPGRAFDEVIERELHSCKCAVVIWSAHSVTSRWVKNEARRANARGVLVPILVEHVEIPLEFADLQAADLTTWELADHPELEAVINRIEELAPCQAAIDARQRATEAAQQRIESAPGLGEVTAAEQILTQAECDLDVAPEQAALREHVTTREREAEHARLAKQAVDEARRVFAEGRHEAAVAGLERFSPVHSLVTEALSELRAENDRLERLARQQETEARREAAAEARLRALWAAKQRIGDALRRGEVAAAEEALTRAERELDAAAELSVLRQQVTTRQREAEHERLAKEAVDDARRVFAEGRRQDALAEQQVFQPAHALVTEALSELRAENHRLERFAEEHASRQVERLEQDETPDQSTQEANAVTATARAAEPPDQKQECAVPAHVADAQPPRSRQDWRFLGVAAVLAVAAIASVLNWRSEPSAVLSAPSMPVSAVKPTPIPPPAAGTTLSLTPSDRLSGAPIEPNIASNREPSTSAAPPVSAGRSAGIDRDVTALRVNAEQHWARGDLQAAMTSLESALKLKPGDREAARLIRGFIEEMSRRVSDAATAAQEARAVTMPGSTFANGSRRQQDAVTLERAGRSTQAVRAYGDAIDLFEKARADVTAVVGPGPAAPNTDPAVAAHTRPIADEQARGKQPADSQARIEATAEDVKSVANDEERILQVLNEYEAAYERMDVPAVSRVHPALPQKALANAFAQYRSYAMTIVNPRVSISGNTATVSCTINTKIRPRVGDVQSDTRRATLRLQKSGEFWVIADRK